MTAATTTTTPPSRPLAEGGLSPFETLYDISEGSTLPLPPELETIYGSLRFPVTHGRPYVIGNLVTSLDGVVSLGIPGKASGKEISGFNTHDRLLMGLLRAAADAVVSGAGTLRASPNHVLTPEHAFPLMEESYRQLRNALGKARVPLNVVVSSSGDLGPNLTILGGEVPALVVTSEEGSRRIAQRGKPPTSQEVRVEAAHSAGPLAATAVLDAIAGTGQGGLVLVEGGPHLMATFFAEGCLDEMFVTLSPQVVGRDGQTERPGLVAGRSLAPEHPAWGTLVGVKRAGSHLFLRYDFGAMKRAPASPSRSDIHP
ncbi:MAG: RibD family protein [Chloroflexia bacterium]